MVMIAIVDYGAGNLHSVVNALQFIGADCSVTKDADEIGRAQGVILPGVGSFEDALVNMKKSGLTEAVCAAATSGKPFLGICLGMQMLFESSEESHGVRGLSLLPGALYKIPADGVKVPHIGWNSLDIKKPDGIFEGLPQETFVYFVHSYYLKAGDMNDVAARTHYSVTIDAAVSHGNLFGVQFHPEKSGEAGLQMLRNFARLCGEDVK